jgi:hypothetical protein
MTRTETLLEKGNEVDESFIHYIGMPQMELDGSPG